MFDQVAPARVPSLGLWVVLSCAACKPTEHATVEPLSVAPNAELAQPPDEADDVESTDDGRFMVTLASGCSESWNATLLRKDEGEPLRGPSRFELDSSTHELWLRPGDALLLTTPHGGIMALDFDGLAAGDAARVDVTPECTSVKQTVISRPQGSASL